MAKPLSMLDAGQLGARLKDLGVRIDYPPTPDMAAAVRARIVAQASSRSFWRGLLAGPARAPRAQRRLALAVVVAAAVLALLALNPSTRDAVARFIGLKGVVITRAPHPLPTPYPPPTPLPAGGLDLGQRISLSEARTRVRFNVLVPGLPELAQPDQVYFNLPPVGGEVTLLYLARPGYRAAPQTGVGVLISEFRGDLQPGFFGKLLGPGTQVEEVSVGGVRGFWISGSPHEFFYQDSSGQIQTETLRLAGNTLLWERAGVTYRVELAGDKATALRIATSMR